MPVSLPTATDVRKAREQAAKNAADRAEVARTPLLAVLGAGDYAVATVNRAAEVARTRAAEARSRATAQAEDVQHRVAELPHRLSTPELRKLVADLRGQAEQAYSEFADRGERAWGRIRSQPQVRNAIATIETYTDKLDARVDTLVDDAHDAAEKALTTVTRQTRSAGEKVARNAQRLAADTAEAVVDVSADASEAVAEAGVEVAELVAEAGDEVAHDARSAGRKAADRTTPASKAGAEKSAAEKSAAENSAAEKSAARKPGVRRTSNGTTTGS